MRGLSLFASAWLLQQSALNAAQPGVSAEQELSAALPSDRYVPVGNGRNMHIRCMGSGKPTVVLLAGLGENAERWRGIQPRIAETTRVCSYDRPGYGKSDPSDNPLHAEYTTSELEKLLSVAAVNPPYIIVCHSYGGFEALLFAHRNKGSTGALVLVDASFPHHDRIFAEASPSFGDFYKKMMVDRIAISKSCISSIESGNDDCVGPPSKPRFLSFMKSRLSVYENWQLSSEQVGAIKTLGHLPLFVLSAGTKEPMQGYDHNGSKDARRSKQPGCRCTGAMYDFQRPEFTLSYLAPTTPFRMNDQTSF